ncbi:phage BR0599 family protein [Pseudomonas resinovorans]|uniref:Phage BR0599 family protein n=1 Tax=Metapseudomonas resinovorans TaxID=53412 RepID=A0ABT4Y8E3_METRE|nr:phage BR0599 family protein [Pseudomonas resinovorans]MDA8485148.1 phage BR0599 family protein [Pseudomonas resinovorans]
MNFDLERMKISVGASWGVVPVGLTPEEIVRWMTDQRRLQELCQSKFNNVIQFMGEPTIPVRTEESA